MTPLLHWPWGVVTLLLLAYIFLIATKPIRQCLIEGLRVLRRYHRLWAIPAGLGLCYALFHAGVTLFFYTVLPLELRPAFGWSFSWSIPPLPAELGEAHSLRDRLSVLFYDPRGRAVRDAGLDGIEALAGLFNNVVTTFPFSAIAALMLFANWEDHHSTLRKALRKRFGRRGWIIHGGILACAVSAIVAPFLYGPSLIYLNRVAPGLLLIRWSALIDWLSSLFAYLFGVAVQVYLILIIYTWLRGISSTPAHLMDVAIRRFSFVVKWAVVVMVISSLLIHLPLAFALLLGFRDFRFLHRMLLYTDSVARPLLAIFLILFSTMQVTLTFHSESLRKGVAQHWQFLRRYWWEHLRFLVAAAVPLFGLALLNRWLLLGFGGDTTSAGILWSIFYPLLGALLAAWLLAAWVSLYRRCETGRLKAPDWIPF